VSKVLSKLAIETESNALVTPSRRLHRLNQQKREQNFNSTNFSSSTDYKTGMEHFDNSPVAKHYYRDPAFLMTFNGTIKERTAFNRKIKLRDTFTKVFPSYKHVPETCYSPSATHATFHYPERWHDGTPTHKIDRAYTHKMDEIKTYSEEMYKISEIRNMRKLIKK